MTHGTSRLGKMVHLNRLNEPPTFFSPSHIGNPIAGYDLMREGIRGGIVFSGCIDHPPTCGSPTARQRKLHSSRSADVLKLLIDERAECNLR